MTAPACLNAALLGGIPASYGVFITAVSNTGDFPSYTFTAVSIGSNPRPTRRIMLAIVAGNDTDGVVPVDSVTIGGIAASMHVEAWPNLDNQSGFAIWSAIVPTGTTADIVVSASLAPGKAGCRVIVYDTTVSELTPYSTYIDTQEISPASFIMNAIEGSFLLAVTRGPSAVTWTGLTKDYEDEASFTSASISRASTNPSINVTASPSSKYMVGLAWR